MTGNSSWQGKLLSEQEQTGGRLAWAALDTGRLLERIGNNAPR